MRNHSVAISVQLKESGTGFYLGEKLSYLLHSLLLTAAQEGPKQTAVQVIQDGDQEVLIELKCCRKLLAEIKN